MSDSSQGQAWWIASDGKWYPPPDQPIRNLSNPPPTSPTGVGWWQAPNGKWWSEDKPPYYPSSGASLPEGCPGRFWKAPDGNWFSDDTPPYRPAPSRHGGNLSAQHPPRKSPPLWPKSCAPPGSPTHLIKGPGVRQAVPRNRRIFSSSWTGQSDWWKPQGLHWSVPIVGRAIVVIAWAILVGVLSVTAPAVFGGLFLGLLSIPLFYGGRAAVGGPNRPFWDRHPKLRSAVGRLIGLSFVAVWVILFTNGMMVSGAADPMGGFILGLVSIPVIYLGKRLWRGEVVSKYAHLPTFSERHPWLGGLFGAIFGE